MESGIEGGEGQRGTTRDNEGERERKRKDVGNASPVVPQDQSILYCTVDCCLNTGSVAGRWGSYAGPLRGGAAPKQ